MTKVCVPMGSRPRLTVKRSASVDLKRVGARSEGGTVILEGRVEDQKEKDAAMRTASKARGARNVVSRLKVEKKLP